MIIKKNLFYSGIEYYENHLTILSLLIPKDKQLTKTENTVLATFLEINSENEYETHINFATRKIVKKALNLSTSSLSTYIKTFREKGYLESPDGKFKDFNIKEFLIPEKKEQKYMLKLNRIADVD